MRGLRYSCLRALAFFMVPDVFWMTPSLAETKNSTLSVQSSAVVIDVVVTDKYGHAVHDLVKEDFEAFEDGVSQTVDFFEKHDLRRIPSASVPEMPHMPPHVYNNVPSAPEKDDPLRALMKHGLPNVAQILFAVRILPDSALAATNKNMQGVIPL